MTHLHTDHAGGLHHFPKSEILVNPKEYAVSRGLMGQLRGYLPQHTPDWFKPKLVEYHPRPFGAFKESYSLTKAGDVWIMPTPGHTDGHQSVILQDGDLTFFFAGDTSYTEALMVQQQMDGVTLNEKVGRETMKAVLGQLQASPTVYLPSHDPESASRLNNRQMAKV
jgi:N-acyl homoserine lactone hydrolase